MSDTLRCPDCGHENPPGSTSCEACNFPLGGPPRARAAEEAPAGSSAGGPADAAGTPPPEVPRIPRLRPIRPRQPLTGQGQATTLWLTFGSICAAVVLFIGLKSNVERASQPVPGSGPEQQQHADELRLAIEKDSTNVEARVALGDLLYNTANWSEAIVHYRAAVRMDSTRVPAIVDLGVCYYNLGDTNEAERYFLLGLAREPHHPIALFNLGIVSEHRGQDDAALDYFHRALESNPPADMGEPIAQAMQRIMQKQGKTAPPISGTR